MKFKTYLNESITVDEFIPMLEKDCQPFLKDWRKLSGTEFLYSGRSGNVDFEKRSIRKNRKPMNTERKYHEIADDWFYKKFGVRSRTNAIFCSFDDDVAKTYGNTYIIFPIGKYKAISSDIIGDLFISLGTVKRNIRLAGEGKKWVDTDKLAVKLVGEMLTDAKYTNKLTNWYNGNEVMLTCKEYYMISSYKYYKELYKYFKRTK